MACVSCGAADPTHIFEFNEEFGLFYVRLIKTRELELCRRCVGRYFLSAFLNNLFLGWWGLISMFKTPINLIQNIAEYWRCRDLELPDAQAMATGAASVIDRPPEYTRVWAKVLPVAAVVIALIVYAVSRMPDIPETAAGESGGDAGDTREIDAGQIEKDVDALEHPLTSKSWSGMRNEILVERGTYYERLTAENLQVQHLVDQVRTQTEANKGSCTKWVLKEFAPVLKEYSGAITEMYTFVKGTPADGAHEREEFASLTARKQSASEAFAGAMGHMTANCRKD